MNPEQAAAIFKEMLMTPVAELDQLPRRCGLQETPRPDDLEHARELLRAIVVGLQSGSGPNWDPIHTAWGAMVARHGMVQDSAMGPEKPVWVRHLPAKPSLGDAPPGAQPHVQPMAAAPPNPAPYAQPPAAPPPMAPVPMGQPPMPMGPPQMAPQPMAHQPMAHQPVGPPQMGYVPQPIPAHERGPRKVARTEPGVPLPPPPPGREAWPQPPAALHGGAAIPAPVGHVPTDAPPVYAAAEGYPAQQPIAPTPGQPGYPQAPVQPQPGYPQAPVQPQPGYPPAPAQPQPGYPPAPQGHDPRASYPPAQPSYPSQPGHASVPVQPSAPPPRPPAAPQPAAQPGHGEDIAISVERYAMFCAACAAKPDQVFQTMVEYGVNSPQARESLDETWQDRFDDDPALQQRWEQLFSQFRGQR